MTTDTPTPSEMVEAVKRHALEHYNSNGWDFVIECMSDADITKELTDNLRGPNAEGIPCTTVAEAIEAVGLLVNLWDERRKDVESTIW